MGRLLFILILVMVAFWAWRTLTAKHRQQPPAEASNRTNERMVRCAHCQLYLPERDALVDGDRCYCSREHRDRARSDA